MKKIIYLAVAICFSTATFANQIDVDYNNEYEKAEDFTNDSSFKNDEYLKYVCDITITKTDANGKKTIQNYRVGDAMGRTCDELVDILNSKL